MRKDVYDLTQKESRRVNIDWINIALTNGGKTNAIRKGRQLKYVWKPTFNLKKF